MPSLGSERNFATVDATVQTQNVAVLAAVGAAIKFHVSLQGVQDNGQRGLVVEWIGNAARNAIGNGFGTPVAIGPTGFTDAAAVPWTTIGVPAGWAAVVAFVGTTLQVQFNAAAGQNVNWQLDQLERYLLGGATL